MLVATRSCELQPKFATQKPACTTGNVTVLCFQHAFVAVLHLPAVVAAGKSESLQHWLGAKHDPLPLTLGQGFAQSLTRQRPTVFVGAEIQSESPQHVYWTADYNPQYHHTCPLRRTYSRGTRRTCRVDRSAPWACSDTLPIPARSYGSHLHRRFYSKRYQRKRFQPRAAPRCATRTAQRLKLTRLVDTGVGRRALAVIHA